MRLEVEATVERQGTEPRHRLSVRVSVDLAASTARRIRECFQPGGGFAVVYVASRWDDHEYMANWPATWLFDACRAGAWSGASFASRRAGREGWDIALRAIHGQVDSFAGDGAAVASMYAVWTAYGYEWTPHDDRDTSGWTLVEVVKFVRAAE